MATATTNTLKNFINGKWVEAQTDHYQSVPNPATGEELAQVPISTSQDVDAAAAAAKEAF
jgi:malonate-semialdehyde dehydrogenase (acetylating) / methylmalonate-semialdehyde dehydrogenase